MIVCPVIGSKQIVRSDPQITLGTPYWWFWPHSAPPCLFFCPSRGQLTYHGCCSRKFSCIASSPHYSKHSGTELSVAPKNPTWRGTKYTHLAVLPEKVR